ncbi:gamma subclass chorismate mutase AroQ [Kordiimonas aestuarii]|uniref:gamma subclass chorismate mutase AroQ n=1 Tax=Kordiimonas aestuarii TaxID=1005925 RepID=UPI0021CFF374|nr:gamma subclass chorismate mutase AroQ [Kordiimonas aestuarii]
MRVFRYLLLLFVLAKPAASADDGLDNLSAAIADRLQVMEQVAHYKWLHNIPVEAPARETEVIKATVEKAAALGLDEQAARRAVTAQMEAARTVQRRLIISWKAGSPPRGRAPDLKDDIRPRINRLTTDFLSALKSAQPALTACILPKKPETVGADIWQIALAGLIPANCAASRP